MELKFSCSSNFSEKDFIDPPISFCLLCKLPCVHRKNSQNKIQDSIHSSIQSAGGDDFQTTIQ